MGSVGLEDGSKMVGARVEVGWRERGSGNLEILAWSHFRGRVWGSSGLEGGPVAG